MVCSISMDWKYKDMRTLILENRFLRVVFLLDKGADIMEIRYKPLEINLLWQSPIGWRNPLKGTTPNPVSEGGFLDYYGGGWQDIVPSAGGHAIYHRGASIGIHGESSMLPWQCIIDEDGKDVVSARLWVEGIRYPFRLEKYVKLHENDEEIFFKARLANTGNQPLEFSWLQHPSFGEPFVQPGSRIFLPDGCKVLVQPESYNPYGRLKPGEYFWPHVKDREGNEIDLSIIPSKNLLAEETSFITDLSEGRYVLWNQKLELGFMMKWDETVFKYLWFWQNYNTPDYPWYGRAWNIALEPSSSYPSGLPEQIKMNTHITLSGGDSLVTTFSAKIMRELKYL